MLMHKNHVWFILSFAIIPLKRHTTADKIYICKFSKIKIIIINKQIFFFHPAISYGEIKR